MVDSVRSQPCAFAFPGVGSRLCGHEQPFFARHERILRPLLEQASDYAHADLVAMLRPSEATEPSPLVAQLFCFAFGAAVGAAYRQAGIEPALVAGHSMGLYAALVAAGAVGFADGLRITEHAHACAKQCCPPGDYDLAAVVGLTPSELAQLAEPSAYPSVAIVNHNNDTSSVLAGRRTELRALVAAALGLGAFKAQLLGVDLPYHHPHLLGAASPLLAEFLRSLSWSRPRCPVISTIDGSLVQAPEELLALTARNLATPIDWQGAVRTMAAQGIARALECGAGLALTQNARLIIPSPAFISLKQSQGRLGI
jgi:[acyl-carrier-protein] S-malonyltransferase